MKKETKIRDYSFALMGVLLMFANSCKKTENAIPILTTDLVINVTQTTATCGGNVTSQGDNPIIARGICWATSQNPTILFPHTTDGSGMGKFTSRITELNFNTTYYVRAYATNSDGTEYGNQVNFTAPWGPRGTVTDIDGNVYHTITIGTQVWMAENLKTTRYNDGNTIPLVTDSDVWAFLTTPGFC